MRKKLSAALFTIIFTSLGAAAITGSGGTGAGIIFDAFDGLVTGTVDSWMDLLLVVIFPFLGVYGISRYLTGKALQIAEENFRGNSSYGSVELGSTEKRMAQFISLAIAAPVVMFFGGAIPYFSLLLSVIAIIWFGWQFIGGGLLSKWSRGGGSTEASQTSTEATREVRQVEDEAQSIRGALKNRVQDEVIGRIEAGEDDTPDQDGREVADEIEEELQQLLQAEKDLSIAMNDEYGDLRIQMKQLKGLIKDERSDEEGLERIKNLEDYTMNVLKDSEENFQEDNLHQVHKDVNEMMNKISEAKQYSDKLKEHVEEEKNILSEEEQSLIQDLENVAEIHELINFFIQADEKLEEEDRELEKIAKELGDQELYQEVEEEEEQEVKLEKMVQELEKHEREIESTFEKADEFLEKVLELDKQEIEEVKKELQEDGQIYTEIDNLVETLQGHPKFDSEARKDISNLDINEMNAKDAGTITELRASELGLKKIRENLEMYGDYASSEMNQIEQLKQKIETVLKDEEEDRQRQKLNDILGR